MMFAMRRRSIAYRRLAVMALAATAVGVGVNAGARAEVGARTSARANAETHARRTGRVPAVGPGSSRTKAALATDLSGLDLIELEIGYTTLLSTYYEAVAPKTLVDGARTGIAAYLVSRGIDATLPYAPPQVSRGAGGDLVTSLVLDATVRYPHRVTADDVVRAAIAGEAASLRDPYTLLFRPKELGAFRTFLNNDAFGGIGATLAIDPSTKAARVESTFAGSPAESAGLRAGDTIVAVDGVPVAGDDAKALGARLRGKIGTTVRVAIARDGVAPAGPLAIVRAKIAPPLVTSKRVRGDVGYLALARFGDDAAHQLRAALDALVRDGVTSLVLDLRGNGGGYGDEATKIASLFVSGPVFSTRERAGATRVERATGGVVYAGRMTVLVDGDSASAAEIVAGALQDDGRATLVGTRTFGKGVVQSIFPLPDGAALKVTTSRYFTPKGRNIDRRGLEPDVVVPAGTNVVRGDPTSDPQLARALDALAGSRSTSGVR